MWQNGGRGLDICYSAAYMSQTRDQKRLVISEQAADRRELTVPWLSENSNVRGLLGIDKLNNS